MSDNLTMCISLAAASVLSVVQPSYAQGRVDGQAIFRQRCQSCHTVERNRSVTVGPNLAGVVGRKAASTTFKYSPALRGANLVWTRANLDRYLQGPTKMVPGTRMAVALTDAVQRAALIAYLAKQ